MSFFGREVIRDRLAYAIIRSANKGIAIFGESGIGKTRLLREVGAECGQVGLTAG